MTNEQKEQYAEQHIRQLIEDNIHEELSNKTLVMPILQQHLKCIPSVLYRYRDCHDRNFKSLEKEQVWLTKPAHFKDLFDSVVNIDIVKEMDGIAKWLKNNISDYAFTSVRKIYTDANHPFELDRAKVRTIADTCTNNNGELDQQKLEKILDSEGEDVQQYRQIFDMMKEYVDGESGNIDRLVYNINKDLSNASKLARKSKLVLCLTEDVDNGKMWEDFADNYKGFCIEYKPSLTGGYDSFKNWLYLLPVIYKEESPSYDMQGFFIRLMADKCEAISAEEASTLVDDSIAVCMQLLYKSSNYATEKEWRISIKNEKNNLQPFPYATAIYMGKDITARHERRLKAIAKRLKIKLYKQHAPMVGRQYQYEEIKY